jgi:hypothetical protein
VQTFLDHTIKTSGIKPRYVITDKAKQFWSQSFKGWCKRRGIQPHYGAVGQRASIAVVERFIRSMKQECTRCLLVPTSLGAMRREVSLYATWYNTARPHMALAGKTPYEAFVGKATRRKRIEPRSQSARRPNRTSRSGDRLRLAVSYLGKRKHLPVVDLQRAV